MAAQDPVLKMLVEGLTQAFEMQEDCDVKFNVEGKVIGTHRVVLKTQCQALYDLSADWTLEKEPICIEDMSYDSFQTLLR